MRKAVTDLQRDFAMTMLAEYTFPRKKAAIYGVIVGILIGYGNTFLDLDFSFRPALLGWLIAAILVVVVLHEGIHGGVGVRLGHRPVFGFEPPLVYTTYEEKIPRGHFIAIALAPLIILDILFVAMYKSDSLKLFADLGFAVNTIGSIGDVWIVLKLMRHGRGTFVQDTKTGVQVWGPETVT